MYVKYVLDDSRREGRRELTQSGQQRQILVFIDSLAARFVFEDAGVFPCSRAEGFGQLAQKLQQITVRGYKLIILLLGRADVWETDKVFFEAVNKVLYELKNQNAKAIVVLGASLPSVLDSKAMVNMFIFRNDKLAARCSDNPRWEHARPGKQLLGKGGPIEEYYDEYGNLNELGSNVVSRALERKICSAKLLDRYDSVCCCVVFLFGGLLRIKKL